MKWTPGGRRNIEDRRGSSGTALRMGGLGLGGALLLVVLSLVTGVDFMSLDPGGGAPMPQTGIEPSGPVTASPEEERLVDMVDAVVDDGQRMWGELLGGRYQPTRAVLFRDAIDSACGFAQSATGPFYCPADRKIYLDLGFFDELHRRLGAPGDFAQAYVLAHELGHHVQTVLGIESDVRQRQAVDEGLRNELSVRMELQADCLAGVWGHHANRGGGRVQLETGDIEEGLTAAAAIGDDRLQRMQTGRVAPDRFTHGTSQQRVEWFTRGLRSGDPDVCNTFGGGT
jgi:predicted metalloprotease